MLLLCGRFTLFLFAPFLDSYVKLDPIEHQEFTRALPHCVDEQIHGNDEPEIRSKIDGHIQNLKDPFDVQHQVVCYIFQKRKEVGELE